LREGTSDLTHGDLKRVVGVGEIVAGRRDNANAALNQRQNAKLLSDEIAREAGRVLNKHSLDAIRLDPI
jgi:hypothetical protein